MPWKYIMGTAKELINNSSYLQNYKEDKKLKFYFMIIFCVRTGHAPISLEEIHYTRRSVEIVLHLYTPGKGFHNTLKNSLQSY